MRSSSSGTGGRRRKRKGTYPSLCPHGHLQKAERAVWPERLQGRDGPRVLGWALASPTGITALRAPARDLGTSGLETYFHRQSQSCSLRTEASRV